MCTFDFITSERLPNGAVILRRAWLPRGLGLVLCEQPEAYQPYVTWTCLANGEAEAGRYRTRRDRAEVDFDTRLRALLEVDLPPTKFMEETSRLERLRSLVTETEAQLRGQGIDIDRLYLPPSHCEVCGRATQAGNSLCSHCSGVDDVV